MHLRRYCSISLLEPVLSGTASAASTTLIQPVPDDLGFNATGIAIGLGATGE
ncbi:MAG: hypothetical protein JWP22_614 [Ramlibacter sp.]|jgi:hypothetical protein|nr:hypothetical protein [Ramlibacter sp.]